MLSPLSPQQYNKRNFLLSICIIIVAIGVSESLAILLVDLIQHWGIGLSPMQCRIFNVILMVLLSTPLLWFTVMRPLALQITASNKELLEALESHVLISITDTQGRIVYANDMFCKVSGYSKEELLGQDHRIVNSGCHDKNYIRMMWDTITGGQVWRGEFCNRRKNGELYWVDSTIAPLPDKAGKPKQYISIRRDTSTRKANELKLTALKRALDASSEMVLITNAEGLIQYANPALCSFTGWTGDALMGQKPYVLDSPTADKQALSEMQSRLRCSEPWSGRLRGRRLGNPENGVASHSTGTASFDSLEYWAKTNITPILAENGVLSGYVQIQHDVSQQVEQEAALQIEAEDTSARLAVSEALHQTLPLEQRLEEVMAILFRLKSFSSQHKGCVFLRSQEDGYLERFVVHDNACPDQAVPEQVPSSDVNHCQELRIAIGEGPCGQVAVSKKLAVTDFCCCDGLPAHGHYIVPMVSGEDILGLLFIFTDAYPVQSESRIAMLMQVGEMVALALLQHQAKVSLEAARDAALQIADTKTEFLANMSHEIRTPMNGVLGMLDLLQDTQLSREQWDLIEIAANSAESLLTIINDILDFSKLEAGKIELEQIEFNLPDLVEEVCTLLSSRAHSKDLELNCFLPAKLPSRWKGDPTRIRQVLTNLIGNAIKFTERGEVSVKVSMSKLDHTGIRFEVVDTGIGIDSETQTRLFQAFSQADSSTSRRYGGTGLGLSISKDLVVLMGGNIGVESALNRGATFWFTLPLEAVDDDNPVPQVNFTDKRALIVDDNATNRMILTHYLGNWGFTLFEADNGPAALAELEAAAQQNKPYDLLLSDMQMPDMDGFDLAGIINKNPIIANTPRILLSSGSIGSESERLASGYNQSLLKPVRQSQLFDAIIAALHLPELSVAPAVKVKEIMLDYSGKQVLVVEDNKVNQKVILAQLAKFQLKPDLANNGQVALDMLEHQTYDLVFMDCQMPVMDGYEATRMLRDRETSEDGKARIPITALTAHASAGEREKCLNAGMDDYLSKPVNRADLAVVLARWLGLPSTYAVNVVEMDHLKDEDVGLVTDAGLSLPQKLGTAVCWDEVSALKRLDDDIDLLAEMIDLFLDEAPVQLAELTTALSRADLLALADAAHAIKGMAGHFCAEKLIGLAVNLELAARNNTGADVQLMASDLSQATLDLIENLHIRKMQSQ